MNFCIICEREYEPTTSPYEEFCSQKCIEIWIKKKENNKSDGRENEDHNWLK
jgi:predicted nucleic acid-binding Zn ribbon protein